MEWPREDDEQSEEKKSVRTVMWSAIAVKGRGLEAYTVWSRERSKKACAT